MEKEQLGALSCSEEVSLLDYWMQVVNQALNDFCKPEFYDRFQVRWDKIPELELMDLRVETDKLGAVSIYGFDGGSGAEWIGLIWPDLDSEIVLSVKPFSTVVGKDSFEDFHSGWILEFIEESAFAAYRSKNNVLD